MTPTDKIARDREAVALAEFTKYFVKNYPGPETIIGVPEWHAPKLFSAALYAIRSAGLLSPAPDRGVPEDVGALSKIVEKAIDDHSAWISSPNKKVVQQISEQILQPFGYAREALRLADIMLSMLFQMEDGVPADFLDAVRKDLKTIDVAAAHLKGLGASLLRVPEAPAVGLEVAAQWHDFEAEMHQLAANHKAQSDPDASREHEAKSKRHRFYAEKMRALKSTPPSSAPVQKEQIELIENVTKHPEVMDMLDARCREPSNPTPVQKEQTKLLADFKEKVALCDNAALPASSTFIFGLGILAYEKADEIIEALSASPQKEQTTAEVIERAAKDKLVDRLTHWHREVMNSKASFYSVSVRPDLADVLLDAAIEIENLYRASLLRSSLAVPEGKEELDMYPQPDANCLCCEGGSRFPKRLHKTKVNGSNGEPIYVCAECQGGKAMLTASPSPSEGEK